MRVRLGILSGVATTTLLACIANSAAAADPPPNAPPPAATQQQAATVGEILVTAERREESIEKVPVSVTAVDSKQIQQLFIENLAGLTDLSPSFTIQGVGAVNRTGAVMYDRGIGYFGSGEVAPPIAVSLDGMFFATNVGTLLNIYDVNRVELLEGPQGTLFGRNTIGGVTQIITNDPTSDFNGSGTVRIGDYGEVDSNVTANLPISDTLWARISVNTQYSNGFYTNLYKDPATGASLQQSTDTGGTNNQAARAKLKWEPDDRLSIMLTGWYLNQKQDSPVGQNASSPTDAIYYAGVPDVNAPTVGRPGIGYPGGPTSPFVVHRDTNGADDLDQWATLLNINYQTPYGFDITSLTTYMAFREQQIDDFSGTDLNYFTSDIFYHQSQFTQEVRAQSDTNNSKLTWQGGAYFFTTSFQTDQDNILGPSFFADGTDASSPVLNEFIGAKEYNFNVAGFGQVSYEVIPHLILTVGARYTFEHTSAQVFPALPNLPVLSVLPAIGGLTNRDSWEALTYHLGIQYNVSDDVMVYATYSTGDQAGGFNTNAETQAQMSPYSPETANAFEAGVRSQWWDHRLLLNLTGFWNTYGDLQVGAFRPVSGQSGEQSFIANSAFERARGVEMQATALPIKGLRLTASVGYLDARYTSFIAALSYDFTGHVCNGLVNGPGSAPIEQNHATPGTPCYLIPSFSPDVTANLAASYDFDLGEHGKLTPHIAWTAETSYYTDLQDAPVGFQPAWSKVDADITYVDPTGRWRISLFGRNLTNRIYLLNSNEIAGLFAVNYYADPRTYGVELEAKFR